MPDRFGAKLRYLREKRASTQIEVAEHLGISRAALTNLEAGRRFPRLVSFVLRTVYLFEVQSEYILNDAISLTDIRTSTTWPHTANQGTLLYFGDKLRQLRTFRSWTQVDLIRALNTKAQAHISLLESGQVPPSATLVIQVANLFSITSDDLLNDTITL